MDHLCPGHRGWTPADRSGSDAWSSQELGQSSLGIDRSALSDEARESLRLGLLTPTQARHLTRLPRGNQNAAMQMCHRTRPSLRVNFPSMVDLLLASSTEQQTGSSWKSLAKPSVNRKTTTFINGILA